MAKNTIKKMTSNKFNIAKRSHSADGSEKDFTYNTKSEQNLSIKRVELNIKIRISCILEEYKPKYPYSSSILFRLNPITPRRPSTPKEIITPWPPTPKEVITPRPSTPKEIIAPRPSTPKEIIAPRPSTPKEIITPTPTNQSSKSEIYHNPKLEEKLNEFQPILHVDLSYFHIIDPDILIIVNKIIREKKCTELWLFGNQITSQGASILSSSLINNPTLKSLDISFNQISNLGVQSLTKVLLPDQHSSLKILQLSKNGISDDGAKYLSEMLKTNQTLTELWLSDNEIGNEGIKQLSNTLSYHNKTLKFISLSSNIFITDLCIDYLIDMFEHNQTLKKYWMTDCNLTQQGQIKLQEKGDRKKNFQIIL